MASPRSKPPPRCNVRQGSIVDLDVDINLKISNYEDTVHQLDLNYGLVKRQLLRHQSPITGMFPVLSTDETVASVRESVYCAAAVWSLYQAYRRIDDDRGKSHELGQSTVKCMRGILECWVKQAPKIELFKKNQCNKHALHCKFHLATGDEVYVDEEYNHLQIDVVSLYLLFLVQMITSGLQIVYTRDEVAFVQNLVYYVERAYRTPDYGTWERGSKYNDGTPEIHASSIGMAKSALEAINGFNLFGEKGASWSVIYVDIDAHNRNRSIFETLLPRESSSKGVDAALLPTILFPAFATHEEVLATETKANVVQRLKGQYGFKRFNRDGYKTKLEDTSRKYYRSGETKEFENIECEWPLFFAFMIIDGVFKTLPDQVEEYENLLKERIVKEANGDPVIPMCYYVPADRVEAEKQEPGSQARQASPEGCGGAGGVFLWNQAMLVISQLLTSGLLHVNELDPIRRYLPSYNRPRKGGRYSAFQGTATDLVVQIVLIAESMRLQAMMATYGIQTQTPHEVEPVQIWSSKELVQVYKQLGVNEKLGLQGRPARPVGALGTSKIYRVCGTTVMCYPLIFEVSEFYLYRDMALLIDDIKTELQFVGRYWRLSGRPTVCLLIREEHMRDPQFKEMLSLFAMLKKGHCDGTKVRIGRLQNLVASSCIEHLDFMNSSDMPDDVEGTFQQFKQLQHDYIGYQSLTDVPKATVYSEDIKNLNFFTNKPIWEVVEELKNTEGLHARAQLLGVLLKREGSNYEFDGKTVEQHLKALYHRVGGLRYWVAVRYCSSLLQHTVDSISPFITTVLVNGKQLTVGVIGHQETVFDKPMTPAEIQSVMFSTVQPYDVILAVLQQEVVLYCGRLIATDPELFKGILKIRVGWVLEAMRLYLRISSDSKSLESHSPFEVRQLLYKILTVREWGADENLTPLQRRQLEGCLCRVPPHFYNQVWDVLARTPQGACVQGCHLPQQPTLSNMMRSELNFALEVEQTLNHVPRPEYRQIIVELLCIVSTILLRNPELSFQHQLDLDHLIQEAFRMFCTDNKLGRSDDSTDLTPFCSTHYSVTIGYLARAVVNNVLQGGQLMTAESDDDIGQEDPCRLS
ncbi:probable phosphorylase b kinase regulatory subunit beta isoform X2 [Bacillus rossius redtenbacheri]|uniref:probable phosphorylase b kinase regulatory subunit beta isoform X2 n=1 Tax=Bacillus rossius redtenbacheri TaxID=93214 RepID=UPI002FDE8BBB